MHLAPGTSIGPYVVQRELARGGQGVVYEVHHPQLGRFALKLLFDDDPEAHERFLREGRTLAKLSHRGLPRAPSMDTLPNGTPYLVLELVPGEDLHTRVKRSGPLPPEEAAGLVAEIADVLHYCHEEGVVHRDLKPHNVVVTPEGRVVVIDFGLVRRDRLHVAWQSQDVATLTQEGEVLGTPAYMPPEQVMTGKIDARSDVYALGATLYHLLTGQPPFRGASVINLLSAIVSKPPPDPRREDKEIPAQLAELCLQSMAKDPDQRPPSAAAFAARLRGEAQGPAGGGFGSGFGKAAFLGAFALGLLLLVALASASRRATQRPTPAARAQPTATAAPSAAPSEVAVVTPTQQPSQRPTPGQTPDVLGDLVEQISSRKTKRKKRPAPPGSQRLQPEFLYARGLTLLRSHATRAAGVADLREAAGGGLGLAAAQLGRRALQARQREEGLDWLRRAATLGDAPAHAELARALEPSDPWSALRHYQAGTALVTTSGLALERRLWRDRDLSDLLVTRYQGARKLIRAKAFASRGWGMMKALAKEGCPPALFEVYGARLPGLATLRLALAATALPRLLRAAEAGDSRALGPVWRCLVVQGMPLADEWLERAAGAGEPAALERLAELELKKGELARARRLFLLASPTQPQAAAKAASMLMRGEGGAPDLPQARGLLGWIGDLLRGPRGIELTRRLVQELALRQQANVSPAANYRLGKHLVLIGRRSEGLEWLREAAKAGQPRACLHVAKACMRRGPERDLKLAKELLAKVLGNKKGAPALQQEAGKLVQKLRDLMMSQADEPTQPDAR